MKEGKTMERISHSLCNAAAFTLDRLLKASGARIMLHGLENVPERPLLFAVNHYTGLEGILIPCILKKNLDLFTISLAPPSLFRGPFGAFIEKLGAVSTGDRNREGIFTGSLLRGDNACLVFPEGAAAGQNGIQKHDSAAMMALKTEFYRRKIKHSMEQGPTGELERYMKEFSLQQKDLDRLVRTSSVIVPVNITYYPMRSRGNALDRLVQRLTMTLAENRTADADTGNAVIIDDIDMDIRFGRAIEVGPCLDRCGPALSLTGDPGPYPDSLEKAEKMFPAKTVAQLSRNIGKAIPAMTTLNPDHVFAWLLAKNRGKTIKEISLRNRAFLAIEKIKERKPENIHGSLNHSQYHLLADDDHGRYSSFINEAISQGAVKREGRDILRIEKAPASEDIHGSARRHNAIKAIILEAADRRDVMRAVSKTALLPDFHIRRKIRSKFMRMDLSLFEEDYRKYSIPGESKPQNIGRPYMLKRWNSRKGVILVHGYMSAPEEMRPLAEHLHRAGFTVYGVRLRGHGTSPEDLWHREWIEWYNSVNRACIIMENTVSQLAIAGFSTGAGLALLQAARKGGRFRCVVSISAPLHLQNIKSKFSSAIVAWNNLVTRFDLKIKKMEFVENLPENPGINYFRNPVRGVYQLGRLMDEVRKSLPKISSPTLVIQGSHDPVVNPESAPEIHDRIGAADREILIIDSQRHGIVRGDTLDTVASTVTEFIERHFRERHS